MSASKHKKQRKTETPDIVLDKKAAELAAKKEAKKYTNLAIITVVLLVVIGSVVGFFSSTVPQNLFTAVTVGDHQLSPAQFTYYYKDAYYNYTSTYGDYISFILDTETPLDDQLYDPDTGETWADYFIGEATTSAAATYELYDAAVAAGYTLPDDELDYINSTTESISSMAMMYGLASGDAYLTQTYGRGATVDGYKEYMTVYSTAYSYADSVKNSFSYDQAALDAAYAADPIAYDLVDYKIYYVSVDTGETNEDGTVIADMDAGLALAEEMAAASYQNIGEFDRYAVELATTTTKADLYSDPSYTLRANTPINQANTALQSWLADEARQEGDTTVVQADDIAYYVAYYIGRPDMDTQLPNVRDIFISATADETNTDDPTGMITAQGIVDVVLEAYASGEDFATLASNYSSDYTTYATGGLYENYTPGTITDLDESWLFDSSRQAGDMTTIETATGYYIFLYEGMGDTYLNHLVETDLRDAEYSAWYTANTTNYLTSEDDFALFFMSK